MSVPSRLTGMHALVTGASRGIGSAIAAALVADGLRVSLLGRDTNGLERLAQQLGSDRADSDRADSDCTGPDRTTPDRAGSDRARSDRAAVAITADVSDPAAVRNAFALARSHFGPVQLLINNAGQAQSAKFTDTDEMLWNRLIGVNLTGTYLCSRQAVPDMLQAGFGRIVNIASIAGLRGAAYISAYASSKHAVIGLTRSLALEYATRNITVNAICPGYANTDMTRSTVTNIMSKTGRSEIEARDALVAGNPQKRLIEPHEVAETVLWLCRPGSESVTGQSIVLAGGEVT